MMVPPYPAKPADRMSIPPATAPQMPMAMSMNGPYVLPFRIFPADQPATNPMMIHDRKYIHFSLTNPRITLRQVVSFISVFLRSLLVSQPAGELTKIQTNGVGSSSHRLHPVQLAVCCAKQGFNRFAVLGIDSHADTRGKRWLETILASRLRIRDATSLAAAGVVSG